MFNNTDKYETTDKEILSRKDLMKMLGKSSPTIWKWGKQGFIREHRLNRTVYYLKSEVLDDIKKRGVYED